jgi:hypothetical protein
VALIGDYLDYAGTKPTPDGLKQIVEYDLPMDPLTTNDERSKAWIRQGRTEKCEMEALLPSVVADALTVAIEELIDTDVLKKVKAKEESDRSGLWYARGVPDFEIRPRRDFANGRRQLGDFARRVIDLRGDGATA